MAIEESIAAPLAEMVQNPGEAALEEAADKNFAETAVAEEADDDSLSIWTGESDTEKFNILKEADKKGMIKAKGRGTALITVKSGNKKIKCQVTVR
ncbi:MAG: hypothetical protein Q4B57_01740 [Eubacteriales bacterium]|nr:hypothetical protein [Eubacteriales bacterium]